MEPLLRSGGTADAGKWQILVSAQRLLGKPSHVSSAASDGVTAVLTFDADGAWHQTVVQQGEFTSLILSRISRCGYDY